MCLFNVMCDAIYLGRTKTPIQPCQAWAWFYGRSMDAHKVFAGAIILFEDNRFAYGEKRMVAIGLLGIAVVVVVHVDDDDTIHIPSMRQASKNEQKTYFANLWRLSRI